MKKQGLRLSLSCLAMFSFAQNVHLYHYVVSNSTWGEVLTWDSINIGSFATNGEKDTQRECAGRCEFTNGPFFITYQGDSTRYYSPLQEGSTLTLKNFRLGGKQCVFDNPSEEEYVLRGTSYEQNNPEVTIKVYYPWFGQDKRCRIKAR